MKRKICLIFVAILCVVSALVALCACNKKDNAESKDNVSRLTEAYYAGESDLFAVTIEKGRREKSFIADGIAKDVCDFTELSITPLKSNEYQSIAYVVCADNKTVSGEIQSGKSGEFTASIALDFVPTTISVTAGEAKSDIELCSILDGKLSSSDVINIAKDAFKDKIDKEYSEGKAERAAQKRRAAGSQQQQRSEDQQGSADAPPHAFFLFLSSTAPAITSSAPAAASTQTRALFTPV